MMYLRLAWRYATRRLVNFIAMAALALALAVQITAMAVLDGMLVDLEKRLRGLGEQITLRAGATPPRREEYRAAAAEMVKSVEGVKAVTPLVQKVGFIEAGGGAEYVWVQGIDLAAELAHSSLADHLLDYKPAARDPSWESGERPGLFMGEQLAGRLGIRAGMEIELLNALRGPNNEIEVNSRRFTVKSLFRSGVFEKDRYGVYVPIEEAAEFYLADEYPDSFDRVEIMVLWLDDPNQAEILEPRAAAAAARGLANSGAGDPGLVSDNWQRRWSQLAQGMRHENNLMELILVLNDAASGFCVFAILVTLVSRRIRDVGLLRCIGASRRSVVAAFLTVGLVIGLAGGGAGVAAGCLLAGPLVSENVDGEWRLAAGGAVETPPGALEKASDRRPRIDRWYEGITGQPLFPPRMFGVADEAGLPIVVYPWKLALYFLVALAVAVLAAVYPALWAAWREPMSALRES